MFDAKYDSIHFESLSSFKQNNFIYCYLERKVAMLNELYFNERKYYDLEKILVQKVFTRGNKEASTMLL